MKKQFNTLIFITAILFAGCNSSSNSSNTNNTTHENTNKPQLNSNESENNNSSQIKQKESFEQNGKILIQTKLDGKKLAWVNSRDNNCKISSAKLRGDQTVYNDAIQHCKMLSDEHFENISNWRLPTIKEAQTLMNIKNKPILIYPDANPNCAIMATNIENNFVYTTSKWNDRDKQWGTAFISSERNHKTAGIRCVADIK